MTQDCIYGINGPVITVKESHSFSMMEMVYVGREHLVGEVIGVNDHFTTIQCYEETTGLKPRRTGGRHRRADERDLGPRHPRQHF